MKAVALILLTLFTVHSGVSQNYFVGYTLGSFARQGNIDVILYQNNQLWPEANLKMNPLMRGWLIGASTDKDEDWFLEAMITNKVMKTNRTQYFDVADQVSYKHRMKYRYNSLNLGFAYGNELIKGGLSIDIGYVRMLRKKGLADSYGKYNYDDFWGKKDVMVSSTIFISIQKDNFVEVRPYFQIGYNYAFFSRDFIATNANNIGVSAIIIFQK